MAQEKISYTHGSIVNIYVVYSLSNITISTDSDSIAECLFGATSLSNNKYTGYPNKYSGKSSKNLIIFGADLSSSSHTENK